MMPVFVDCEAEGPCPATGRLTEIGAVAWPSRREFYGDVRIDGLAATFRAFELWLEETCGRARPVLVSDNPAFDWQWVNDGFHRTLGLNPFGYTARRIGDFAAGLAGDWSRSSWWKKLRVIPHDHNPVHDALGNLEAWERLVERDVRPLSE